MKVTGHDFKSHIYKTRPFVMKSESKIQQEIFRWYWNKYCRVGLMPRCMIFHVPNQNQYKLTGIGVLPGVADLVVWHYGQLNMVEVKEPAGRQSDSQKEFERHCKDCGIPYYIVHSLEEFQSLSFYGNG